jgi:hypothetical protein
MCFSPQADVTGALVVGVVGVDTIRQVRDRQDWPLASVPLLFAAHFAIEALVWWGLDGKVSASVGRDATWLYLLIALVVVPAFVPIAVTLAEPSHRRRRVMALLSLVGVAVAIVMLQALVKGPVSAHVQSHCIAYSTHLENGGQLTAMYVLATCGVLLLSSSRRIVAFGVANVVVVGFLAWLMTHEFISLWCAWAAIASVAIDLHLRHKSRDHPVEPPRGPPARAGSARYSP